MLSLEAITAHSSSLHIQACILRQSVHILGQSTRAQKSRPAAGACSRRREISCLICVITENLRVRSEQESCSPGRLNRRPWLPFRVTLQRAVTVVRWSAQPRTPHNLHVVRPSPSMRLSAISSNMPSDQSSVCSYDASRHGPSLLCRGTLASISQSGECCKLSTWRVCASRRDEDSCFKSLTGTCHK